jgi:hypothetical protein
MVSHDLRLRFVVCVPSTPAALTARYCQDVVFLVASTAPLDLNLRPFAKSDKPDESNREILTNGHNLMVILVGDAWLNL